MGRAPRPSGGVFRSRVIAEPPLIARQLLLALSKCGMFAGMSRVEGTSREGHDRERGWHQAPIPGPRKTGKTRGEELAGKPPHAHDGYGPALARQGVGPSAGLSPVRGAEAQRKRLRENPGFRLDGELRTSITTRRGASLAGRTAYRVCGADSLACRSCFRRTKQTIQ